MLPLSDGIFSTIGRTPFISLEKLYPEVPVSLYAKLEMFNPGGSSKDRPAWLMLSKAMEEGKIGTGSTIVESSSGNMAIGLAQACRYLNLNLIVVVDPKINRHTLKILQTYGAKIDTVSEADSSGNYLNGRLNRVQELLDIQPDSYWPNQYANPQNTAAQFQTMEEIVTALPESPDYLLAATSTCGTIMGCANYVEQNNLDTKIVAVDAVGSVIFGAPSADRLVPGHGAGRPSDLLVEGAVDHVLHITDEECITGCRRLLDREAILAGGSSGAVVMALEKLQSHITKGSTCALILADSGERYLDTVFNDEWVEKHFGRGLCKSVNGTSYGKAEQVSEASEKFYRSGIHAPLKNNSKLHKITKIAIIGGGPKGTFGFERLAAQFAAFPPANPVEIHIYNKTAHFGAGDIYNPYQPEYLLINNPIGDINMWVDEEPAAVVNEPPALTDWLIQNENPDITPFDYTGRDAVGRYLTKGFEQIATNLPNKVSGNYIVGEVTDISKNGDQYMLGLKDAAGHTTAVPHCYDHILLATGHPRNRLTKLDKQFHEFAGRHPHLHFIPFIYPVEKQLADIMPHHKVAVKGIGLTFVDAVLALTEGRDGTFKREAKNDKLLYRRSGNEPNVIYPFSRSGLPMIPRKPAPTPEPPLKFFKLSALKTLQENQPDGKLDFQKQIWPLLKQEYLFAFYNVKLRETGFKSDLSSCATFAEVMHHVTAFHEQHPDAARFNPDLFLQPDNNKIDNARDYHRYIQSHLYFYLGEAKMGPHRSPWAAATSVWRKATPVFTQLYNFGGLTAASQQFFDNEFRRLLNRVTFGPPVESMEKLIALIEAGILRFDMAQKPAIMVDKDKERFILESSRSKNKKRIDVLVDARIARVSIHENQSAFYRNLLRRGLVSLYENTSGDDSYTPGCIAVSAGGFVIKQNGSINTDIAVTGTPTEGVTFDNDALSRTRNNFVSEWAASIRKLYTQSTVKANDF